MRQYEDILKRCKEQGIDTTDCHVYIVEPSTLDGNVCSKGTLSQDKRWICLAEKEYVPIIDDYTNVPVCYEIKDKFSTYVSNGCMYYLVEFYLLYRRR